MSEKKLTQQELFRQYLEDEQLLIDSLKWDTDNFQESSLKLQQRLEALEEITFEAKSRATKVSQKLREENAKRGKNIWDKVKPNPDNLINSGKDAWEERKKKEKKVLSKLDKIVQNCILMGYTDDEIFEFVPPGLAKGADIRELIQRFRE